MTFLAPATPPPSPPSSPSSPLDHSDVLSQFALFCGAIVSICACVSVIAKYVRYKSVRRPPLSLAALTVRVEDLRHELHVWGLVRVVLRELQDQSEGPAVPWRVLRPENDGVPAHDVLRDWRAADPCGRVLGELLKVTYQPLRGRGWRGEKVVDAPSVGPGVSATGGLALPRLPSSMGSTWWLSQSSQPRVYPRLPPAGDF